MRSIAAVVAAVFSLLSCAVFAEPSQRASALPLSDAQLDEITAGAVTTLSVILTPGNGGDPAFTTNTTPSGNVQTNCHNCDAFGGSLEQGGAQGFRLKINNGHPDGKIRCFGGSSLPLC